MNPVVTGAQVLANNGFDRFRGKRIGLITNQTGTVDSGHLIDALHESPDVDLAALFGPEHGLRGSVADGAAIADGVDPATGIAIYSLYGANRSPSSEVLAGLDALLFDIQDIGARFYTFISTMGLSMQAAAEAGVPFVVLDRPNPLGGRLFDGYVLDSLHTSFVGLYPIPVQHGMTVGELALMIKGERLLEGLENLDLDVVELKDWRRDMLWPETQLPWIPTRPNIPSFMTALVYAGTCFFEGTTASEGRGTDSPFLKVGAPWLDAISAARSLNELGLSGVQFSSTEVEPREIPGTASNPKFEGKTVHAVQIEVTSIDTYAPVSTGIAVLSEVFRSAPDSVRSAFIKARWLGLLSGTDRLQASLERGDDLETIQQSWREELSEFGQTRQRYLRYE